MDSPLGLYPLTPFQPTFEEINFFPQRNMPLEFMFDKLIGDEIFILAKVCKIWNQLLLKRIQKNLMLSLPELKKFITVVSSAMEKCKCVQVQFLKTFKNDGTCVLENEVANIPYLTTQTPFFTDQIIMRVAGAVAEVIGEDSTFVSDKIKNGDCLQELKDNFYYCLEIKRLEKKDTSDELKILRQYLKFEDTSPKLQIVSKISFLKIRHDMFYQNYKNAAVKNIITELIDIKYFNIAFKFAVTVRAIHWMVAKHLIAKLSDVDALCILMRHITERKLQFTILKNALTIDSGRVLCYPHSVVEIFKIFIDQNDYMSSEDGLIMFQTLSEIEESFLTIESIFSKLCTTGQTRLLNYIVAKKNIKQFTKISFYLFKSVTKIYTRGLPEYELNILNSLLLNFREKGNFVEAHETLALMENDKNYKILHWK